MMLGQILPILVGSLELLVAVLLLLSYRTNKHVNIFLIIILALGAIRLLHNGLMDNQVEIFTNDDFSWIRFATVMTVPISYLYIRMLVNDNQRVSPKMLLHLLYPIVWSTLLKLQYLYHFIPADVWHLSRRINIVSFITVYLILILVLIKNFNKDRNQDYYTTRYFDSMKSWVYTFVFFIILIDLRSLIHFLFDLENNGGIFSTLSSFAHLAFLFLLNLKVLTTPELLFGYAKLKKSLTGDAEEEDASDNRIVLINNQFYLKNKPIHNYFEGKTLECLLFILKSENEFVNLISLDDIFVSEYKASLPTVKKRREQSIKEIKFLLSFRLEVPLDAIFIESRDEIDKRIKLIKINPDLLLNT
jgi:hypothetical protein